MTKSKKSTPSNAPAKSPPSSDYLLLTKLPFVLHQLPAKGSGIAEKRIAENPTYLLVSMNVKGTYVTPMLNHVTSMQLLFGEVKVLAPDGELAFTLKMDKPIHPFLSPEGTAIPPVSGKFVLHVSGFTQVLFIRNDPKDGGGWTEPIAD